MLSLHGMSKNMEHTNITLSQHLDSVICPVFTELCVCSKGRFVFFTAWRNIDGTNPVHDHPLAVCDERSLVKPDDYICSDLHFEHESKQLYHLNEANHKRHRWYYYPQMRQDEVLIFKNWDSDRDQPARIVFHTAFRCEIR